jgi:hypothetical protein
VILPLLALLAFSSPAALQATSRTTLVTVADARNQPILDLGPDDVVIREGPAAPGNNVVREILSVHAADYPVIVLVDTGSAARDDFPQIRHAVIRFVDRLGRRPVAVGTLSDPPALLTSFDDEPEQPARRLDTLTASPSSDSLLLQAVTMAAQKLRETGSLFSAIVVVSASASDRTVSRPDELIGPIVDSGSIVHVVANRPPATVPSEPPAEQSQMLRTVVQQTLGQLTVIYSAASYQAALDRLADRMSSELMIEYLVPAGSKASDVKVGVRIPGARVRGLGVRPRD